MMVMRIIEFAILFCIFEVIFVVLHELTHYMTARVTGTRGRIQFKISKFLGIPTIRGHYVPETRLQGIARKAVAIAPLTLLPAALWLTLTIQNTGFTKWASLAAVAASIPSSGDLMNFFRNEEGYVPKRVVPFLNDWDLLRATISFLLVVLI